MMAVSAINQGTGAHSLKALHKLYKCLGWVFFFLNERFFSFSFTVPMLITVLNNQSLLPLRPSIL